MEQKQLYIMAVDIANTGDVSIQNLICLSCKEVIDTSKYDASLPGMGFTIPNECPICGATIRRPSSESICKRPI